MDNELVFRIALLVLFVAFAAHRGYYSRKLAVGQDKTVTQRQENFMTRLAGLLGIAGLIAAIVYMVAPQWVAFASLDFPGWLRWAGVGIALAGFGLLQWAHWALGKNWSDTPRLLHGQQLVTAGPYRWIRHPIYTAFLLIMSATLFISANWLVGGLFIGMTALEVMSRIQYEENLMLETFGETYREQMKHTGRLLPRLMQ